METKSSNPTSLKKIEEIKQNIQEYTNQIQIKQNQLSKVDDDVALLTTEVNTLRAQNEAMVEHVRDSYEEMFKLENRIEEMENERIRLVEEFVQGAKNAHVTKVGGVSVPTIKIDRKEYARIKGEIEAMELYENFQKVKIAELMEIKEMCRKH